MEGMEHGPDERDRVQFAVKLYTELIVRGVACRLDDLMRLIPDSDQAPAATEPPTPTRPTPGLPEAA